MIINPDQIKIVFKCHDCGAIVEFCDKDGDLGELIIGGIEDIICEECEDGEIELSHFETKQ